jgi:hypothetical protein
MFIAWNVGNQFGCQFLGMGTNSDAAKKSDSIKVWCWRITKKIKLTEMKTHEEVLDVVKEKGIL